MRYVKISASQYCLRLEKGDEILQAINDFCKEAHVCTGYFHGIGATNSLTISIYDQKQGRYIQQTLKQSLEITSLSGNISLLNNEIYLHAHINASDYTLKVFGGHLNRAIISVTAEIFVTSYKKKILRKFDKTIGINLLKI
ncbi:MAG: DNA-binding protein [Mycoplasmataceae bacterium]|jgi:predicted DNA-binding protein with PD1-like motif|nr:DNA-binding protein [Mycoplasmataceae bacterium]